MIKRLAIPSVLVLCLIATSAFAQKDAAAKRQATTDRKQTTGSKEDAAKLKEKAGSRQKLTSKKADNPARKKTALDQRQQDAAVAFARDNHPELVPLIRQLKKNRNNEYQRALRDLSAAATRFGRLRERLPADRYEQQLAAWKLDSRIRLQLAKWSVSKDRKLEADIRKSLAERQSIQRQQYEDEIARLKERQSRLESLLEKFGSDSVAAEWERLSKSVGRRTNRDKRKPDDKKKSDPEQKKTNSGGR